MTDPAKPLNGGVYYRLTHEEWLQAAINLKPAEIKVLYYLRTLDPFGNWLDIHVTKIAARLALDKGTVSRALHGLASKNQIELEIQTARIRLSSCAPMLSTDNTLRTDNHRCVQTTTVAYRQRSLRTDNTPKIEPAQGGGSREGQCTNNKTNKFVKTNKLVHPPTHPVLKGINREGIGTEERDPLEEDVEKLSALIEQAGARPNRTIQKVLATLLIQESSAAATKIVENAISALQERQREGTVRNPGGFLVAALRRHFTANQAKKQVRVQRQEPPSLNQVSLAIDRALMAGDRGFALARLQQLWLDGWHDQVEELLQLRRDWGFSVTEPGGVIDAGR